MLTARIGQMSRLTAGARMNARVTGVRTLLTSANASELRGSVPSDENEPFTIEQPKDYFHEHLNDGPSLTLQVTKKQLVDMYKNMVQIRRMETAAMELYKQKLIRGFCHLAVGQEAVPVGMYAMMNDMDRAITSYRCHAYAYLMGGSVEGVLGELMGRTSGLSKGKGGSMHIFTDIFAGGHGIVGAQVPLGTGLAFAQKYRGQGNDHATFVIYGDGAANQGQVAESFNMAKLWSLPAIFTCENNLYGMGTASSRAAANSEFYKRGDLIPGVQVNGQDALAVLNACQYAKSWTTAGKGPIILEMVTYRYGGHSMSDPGTSYRSREEVQHVRSTNDPINGMRSHIIDWGILPEEELKAIDKKARKDVDHEVELSKQAPVPDVNVLYNSIYVDGTNPTFMRGRDRGEVHHFPKELVDPLL